MHSTCLRPSLVRRGCAMPCVQLTFEVPLLVLVLPAGLLVPRRVVGRWGRVGPQRGIRRREISADQGWRVGVVHALRVARH